MIEELRMMIVVLLSSIAAIVTFFLTPYVKSFLEESGIVGVDQHKREKPRLATSAGIILISGFILSICVIIFVDKFIFDLNISTEYIFAALTSIFIATSVGLLDDLNLRNRRKVQEKYKIKEYRIGLKAWQKPLLTIPAAIPLMVVRVGVTYIHLPFIGAVDFGILYNLILIPIAVVCVTNAYNLLAGMNGLESGLGIIAFLALGVFSIINKNVNASIIAFSTLFALVGFIKYNWYPAKFLPGDSLTYMLGVCYVSTVIIGNFEKFGILVFIPWIIEAFLKLRSRFKARSLGDLQKDRTLRAPYGKKIYSLTHLVMNIKPMKEQGVTISLILFEIIVVIVSFFLVFNKII
jgi:UDP-N-acetylglucosamine--dolichyl-phosphate N-acetylglucosaminephosphotransferase